MVCIENGNQESNARQIYMDEMDGTSTKNYSFLCDGHRNAHGTSFNTTKSLIPSDFKGPLLTKLTGLHYNYIQ